MTQQEADIPGRRPLASRQWPIMQHIADGLIACRVSPNAISVSSVGFGVLAGASFATTRFIDEPAVRFIWIVAAVFIQCRLLANLFDGMVAVGSGQRSPLGDVYNEVPDRISDIAIFLGAGYAAGATPWLGYLAAVVVVFVAYVRAIGAAAGAGQCFLGPMAKQHRMFVMTIFSIAAACLPPSWRSELPVLQWSLVDTALAIVVIGGAATAIRRLLHIASKLQKENLHG